MLKTFAIALRTALVTLIATGGIYPLLVTAIGSALFHDRAAGSLIDRGDAKPIGSELIAQGFSNAAYFQPRPSGAGEHGYDAQASSGTNLGPTSAKLRARVEKDVERLRTENPDARGPVPVELVTASASGLDPHLSIQGALWQVPRIAKARNVAEARVKAIVDDIAEGSDLGFIGEPTVNVLRMNVALDKSFGRPSVVP